MSVNHSTNTQMVYVRILDDLKSSSSNESLKNIVTDALTSISSISLIAVLSEIKATFHPQSDESKKVEIAAEFLISKSSSEPLSTEEPSFTELVEAYNNIKASSAGVPTLNKYKKTR